MNSAPIGGRQSASSFVCVCVCFKMSDYRWLFSSEERCAICVAKGQQCVTLSGCENCLSSLLHSLKSVFCQLHKVFISSKSHVLMYESQASLCSGYKCYHQSAVGKVGSTRQGRLAAGGEEICKCVQAWFVTSLCTCDVCECKGKALRGSFGPTQQRCAGLTNITVMQLLGIQKKGRDVNLVSAEGQATKHRSA